MRGIDFALETLLDLNGFIVEIGEGFWVKIEAKQMRIDPNKPFGIKYCLTLHNPEGERIFGIDNAHAAPKSSSKEPHDHMHKGTRIQKYSYLSAEKLLADFWSEVENILKRRG